MVEDSYLGLEAFPVPSKLCDKDKNQIDPPFIPGHPWNTEDHFKGKKSHLEWSLPALLYDLWLNKRPVSPEWLNKAQLTWDLSIRHIPLT